MKRELPAITPPVASRRQYDVIRAEAEDVVGRHLAFEKHLDIAKLGQHQQPVIAHAHPG